LLSHAKIAQAEVEVHVEPAVGRAAVAGDSKVFSGTGGLVFMKHLILLSLMGLTLMGQDQTPSPPQRIRVGGNVQAANLIKKVTPVYPPLAKQARIQGTVRFTVIIGKQGGIENIQLISGHPLLVPSATEAVKQWVYKPTLLNGEPVEVVTQIDVNFTLSEDWIVNWTFLSKFQIAGAGTPDQTWGTARLNPEGHLQTSKADAREWKFQKLILDDDKPFEPTVYFVSSPADLPDIRATWTAMSSRIVSSREAESPKAERLVTVTVDCVINREGLLERILAVTGDPAFGALAREAAQQYKFRPVVINGEPYPVRTVIPFDFR
jgi:TonB family protein